MKNFLSLLLLIAFTVTAFANPFSDVPFTHWAYDAVAKLSSRGIVTGFPDGSFKGNRTMTRYELAMVVARLTAAMEDGSHKGIKTDDYSTLRKLSVEFADELALLGVKVMALEDDVAMVRDEVDSMKRNQRAFGGEEGGIKLSGELRTRYTQRNFDGANSSYINGNAATGTLRSNGSRGDSATETIAQRMRMFLDAGVNEDISFHLALQYTYQDWGSGIAGTERNYNAGFQLKRAYVEIKDFFGWTDMIRIGRQSMRHAHDLLYFEDEMDGIYMEKSLRDLIHCNADPYSRRGRDIKLSSYAVVWESTAQDLGINVASMALDFDVLDNASMKVYYINKTDHNDLHNPGGSFTEAQIASTAHVNQTAEYANNGQYDYISSYSTNYYSNWRKVTGTDYIGAAISGTILDDISYYGEVARQSWKQRVMDPSRPDGTGKIDNQYGYVVGLEYTAPKNWGFKVDYRHHGAYFEPLTATKGVFSHNLNPGPDFGGDFPTVWDSLGYTRDFSDLYLRADYKLSSKAGMFAGFESIRDGRDKQANEFADDVDVWSLGLQYWYKENTFFQIGYYSFDGKDATNGAFPLNSVGATNRTVGTLQQNLHLGRLGGTAHEEDQGLLRMEMHVRF